MERVETDALIGEQSIRLPDKTAVRKSIYDGFNSIMVDPIGGLREVCGHESASRRTKTPVSYRCVVWNGDIPVSTRQKVCRTTDPVSLHEGESARNAESTPLHAGLRQNLEPTTSGAPREELLASKDEDANSSITTRHEALFDRKLLQETSLGQAKPAQRILREKLQIPEGATVDRTWENPRVVYPVTTDLETEKPALPCFEEKTVNTSIKGASFEATGGARWQRSGNTYASWPPPPESGSMDIVVQSLQCPARCGLLCLRRFPDCSSRLLLTGNGWRKCARKSRKGEATTLLTPSALPEEHHQTLGYEWENFRKLGAHGSATSGVGKLLQFLGDKLPPARADGSFDPRMKMPGPLQRIPTSMDQTSPTSFPNLLGRSISPPVVPFGTKGVTTRRIRRLRYGGPKK